MRAKLLGESRPMKELLSLIERVSQVKTNVMILGESGTGKELVARMIHESGAMKTQPFVPVNCGAIPENLIETELFGHHKGSFTGAVADKMGLFEVANRGTLFLDEVGELPLSMQVKLLRAIQERVIRKVGGIDDINIDVRILAATNKNLEAAVQKGTFREDLYYRLNVISIKTPPLRERAGDVELLARAFLERVVSQSGSVGQSGKNITGFQPAAIQALISYGWPGNVRELENVVERAVALESGTLVSLASLPEMLRKNRNPLVVNTSETNTVSSKSLESGVIVPGTPGKGVSTGGFPTPDFSSGSIQLEKILADIERAYLQAALQQTAGKKRKAADLLGISFRSLRYRLIKLGMMD